MQSVTSEHRLHLNVIISTAPPYVPDPPHTETSPSQVAEAFAAAKRDDVPDLVSASPASAPPIVVHDCPWCQYTETEKHLSIVNIFVSRAPHTTGTRFPPRGPSPGDALWQ